jgi:1-phosphofructokinase family hexose kinase
MSLHPAFVSVLLNPAIDRVYEVDGFEAGATLVAKKIHVYPVGKAISVSLGLAIHGEPVHVVALIGKNETDIYARFLDEKDISSDLVPVDGPTRNNITIIDVTGGTTTHLREAGFTATDDQLETLLARLPEPDPVSHPWLVCAGSIPPGLDETAWSRVIKTAHDLGYPVSLDASGLGLKHAVQSEPPELLKINRVELEYLLGDRDDDVEQGEEKPRFTMEEGDNIIEAARRLLGDTLKTIVITLGSQGAIAATMTEAWHCITKNVQVVNTVGAGDAFHAGFLHGLRIGTDLQSALQIASATAAASIRQHCAGAFDHDAFIDYMNHVEALPIVSNMEG